MTRRVGLIGGTFDPVHHGHLDAAVLARHALRLERVRFIPSKSPPHRPATPVASGYHRFAMVALAVAGFEGFEASDHELEATGPSYTWHTLSRLHDEGFAPTELFFILGADAFIELPSWYQYPEVLDAAHFVVVERPGTPLDSVRTRVPALAPRMVDARELDHGPRDATRVVLVPGATRDASSTDIRQRLAAGDPVEDLVPRPVADHIGRHGLYG